MLNLIGYKVTARNKNRIPVFYIFRILLISGFLYGMLVFPYFAVIRFQQSADIIPAETLEKFKRKAHANHQLNEKEGEKVGNEISLAFTSNKPELQSVKWHRTLGILSVLVLIGFNIPFKIYFRKKRKGRKITEKLQSYTKKYIRYVPVFNSLILFVPILISNLAAISEITQLPEFPNNFLYNEKRLQIVHIIASLLVGIFIFFWQKNRLRFVYLEHVFSPEELKKPAAGKHKGKISKYFLSVNFIIILFPLVMVFFYLSTAVTQFSEFDGTDITTEQKEVLFNKYLSVQNILEPKDYMKYAAYINADNFYIMLWGLVQSSLTAFIFLAFFINWSVRLVVKPVNELLANMRATGKGQMGLYGIVRSTDEIGQLSAEYNIMSEKLKNYFDEVNDLNKNLEKKVIERTKTISNQKEEIESQRDDLLNKNTEIEAQNEEIIIQRDQLSAQKKEITDSIFYAQRIQQAVMPENTIFSNDEALVYLKPRDIVSGDFYYFNETDTFKVFAAADCTGHGVPGAFMSMLGISFLNEILKSEVSNAADILEELRREVKSSLRQYAQNARQKDGMDMALCLIDKNTNELHYAGAYNPLIIVRNNELIEYKAVRNPVGIYVKEKPFENHRISLQKSDMLYVFSDGYIDQFGGKHGKKFKTRQFKALLTQIAHKSINEQFSILDDTLNSWKGNYAQTDDIIILGIRII